MDHCFNLSFTENMFFVKVKFEITKKIGSGLF